MALRVEQIAEKASYVEIGDRLREAQGRDTVKICRFRIHTALAKDNDRVALASGSKHCIEKAVYHTIGVS
jgi:hypothetical protein